MSKLLEVADGCSQRGVSDESSGATAFTDAVTRSAKRFVWWVYGTILAQSACQTAVITALLIYGHFEAICQRLREWLYDGRDKAARGHRQVDVSACFKGLLGWLLTGW